ncbi:MAG: hypothetical protein ACK4R6_01270 [Spirosomataceae bacterium]
MNRELAAYLFFDVPLYKNPVSDGTVSANIPRMQESSSSSNEHDPKEVFKDKMQPLIVPKTSKKHAWFLGEKPVGEKKELLVKLLAAVHLKGSDAEFFFEKQPVFPFIEANTHVETVFVFGQEAAFGELIQPLNQPQMVRNTALVLTNSLPQLVANTTSEKRNLWAILKKLYLEAAE